MIESKKNSQDNLAEEDFSNGKAADLDSQGSGCMALRPGQLCPVCGKGMMNYNGLLILCCSVCGYREPGGGFT